MLKNKLPFIVILIFILLPIGYGAKYYTIPSINTANLNTIKEEYDLSKDYAFIQISTHFLLEQEYIKKYNNISIGFDPLELKLQEPAKVLSSEICFTYKDNKTCNSIEPNRSQKWNESVDKIYYIYEYFVSLPNMGSYLHIDLNINYTISNFIIQQGDSQTIWLRTYCQAGAQCPSLDSMSVEKVIILPSNTSVPTSFPNDAFVTMFDKKWAFVLKGHLNENQFIWFKDEQQIQKREKELMEYGVSKGFRYGILASFIGAFLFFLIQKLLQIRRKRNNSENQKSILYFCKICNKRHRFDSNIGKNHLLRVNNLLNKYVRSLIGGVVGGLAAGLILWTIGKPLWVVPIIVVFIFLIALIFFPHYRRTFQ